ncbi:MAG: UDP-glucose 4-epimerase GalE [Pseudomonadota bacterium]
MQILVTGGAGYIGSHTCLELLENNWDVVVVDNLSNSTRSSLDRVMKITEKTLVFHQIDLLDQAGLAQVLSSHSFDAVIHFAGLKAVGESVDHPLRYYHNNITGTLNLLNALKRTKVRNFIFSSSATVYGDPQSLPITETFPLSVTNPYGRTKLMIEDILRDLHRSDPSWNIALLRYFNPVGAHISGLIGEDPQGIPNNLVPYITQVAVGRLDCLNVWGNDYPTPDGTGVRDYIHVCDLALGHIKAIPALLKKPGIVTYNLGTGRGYSVLEMIRGFERVCGKTIPYRIMGRRAGDIAACYADPGKARRELGWETSRTLDDMCVDTWRWQSMNPNGYR